MSRTNGSDVNHRNIVWKGSLEVILSKSHLEAPEQVNHDFVQMSLAVSKGEDLWVPLPQLPTPNILSKTSQITTHSYCS